MEQLLFQLGAQLTALQAQVQSIVQAMQSTERSLQETRDGLEKLGTAQGLAWSKDLTQWVSQQKLAALRSSPLDSPST